MEQSVHCLKMIDAMSLCMSAHLVNDVQTNTFGILVLLGWLLQDWCRFVLWGTPLVVFPHFSLETEIALFCQFADSVSKFWGLFVGLGIGVGPSFTKGHPPVIACWDKPMCYIDPLPCIDRCPTIDFFSNL